VCFVICATGLVNKDVYNWVLSHGSFQLDMTVYTASAFRVSLSFYRTRVSFCFSAVCCDFFHSFFLVVHQTSLESLNGFAPNS